MSDALDHPESIHPLLWRGSQLAARRENCISTGFAELDAELPGGGWPQGSLIDLLVQQAGIGELRLLRAPLSQRAGRPVMLLQPPHSPNALAFANWGIPLDVLHWLQAASSHDALWCAEQVLRAGTSGALLFWQQHLRNDTLRRLHLAAQMSDTLFFVVRPLAVAAHASPAPLRLTLTCAAEGLAVRIVKRRGPVLENEIRLPLSPSPILLPRHAPLDRRTPAPSAARNIPADLFL